MQDRETGRIYAVAEATHPELVGIYNRKGAYRRAVADRTTDPGVGKIFFAAGTNSKAFSRISDAESWFRKVKGYTPLRIEWA